MLDYQDKSVTLDDMVFEGRNKAYGAFPLRQRLMKNASLALGLTIGAVTVALAGPLLWDYGTAPANVRYTTIIDVINIPMPGGHNERIPTPPTPPAPPAPPVSGSSQRYVDFEVAKPGDPVEEPTDQKNLHDKNPGTRTNIDTTASAGDADGDADGVPGGEPGGVPGGIAGGTPGGTPGGGGLVAPVEEVYEAVEEMPGFPGGLGEMQKFLQARMKYPTQAQKSEVQGTVYVEILVGADGAIHDAKVVRPLGFGLDEEAQRLVNQMPSWTPGKQNGRAVKVRMTIPIKFRLQ